MKRLKKRHHTRGAFIDSHGFDAGKLIKGKKRHILVDMQGLLLHAIVRSAGVQDRDGDIWFARPVVRPISFSINFPYRARQSPAQSQNLNRHTFRSNQRVRLERTIAWLNRCRRLAKDWENLNRNALAFLKLVSIRLMLRKLYNP
jgi:transposase